MPNHLQVSIVAATPPVDVTPIDLPISDAAAAEIQAAISLIDLGDATPGDGIVEEKVAEHVKVNFAFVHLDTTVNATAILKVVVKPAAA